MPRKTSFGITPDRLPQEIRAYVPAGREGEALADWYLTFEAGRRFGQGDLAAGLGAIISHLEQQDQLLGVILDRLSGGAQAPSAPTMRVVEREPWDDAKPAPPQSIESDAVELSPGDQATIIQWVHGLMQHHGADKQLDAMRLVDRLIRGYVQRPDGEIIKGPPWRNLPSGGFEGIIYAMLERHKLVPPLKSSEDDISGGWQG